MNNNNNKQTQRHSLLMRASFVNMLKYSPEHMHLIFKRMTNSERRRHRQLLFHLGSRFVRHEVYTCLG